MTNPVDALIEAIGAKDPAGMRRAYAPDARLVTMSPNTFQVHAGIDAVVAKLTEWFASWEEDPAFSFLATIHEGERSLIEFERTSTFEGAAWVVRQAHIVEVGPAGIREHRIYCTGPRQGEPELAAAYGSRS